MNASCESFMDYAYEGFHPITSIKERLKKICAYLYKKCDRAYHSLKNKHPKIANIFKRFAEFFKRHSNIVDKMNSKDKLDEELEQIKKKSEEMDKEWEKAKKVADQNLEDVKDLQQKVHSSKIERRTVLRNSDGTEVDITGKVKDGTKHIYTDKKTGEVVASFTNDKDNEEYRQQQEVEKLWQISKKLVVMLVRMVYQRIKF